MSSLNEGAWTCVGCRLHSQGDVGDLEPRHPRQRERRRRVRGQS
jgi:hypothetical protein